MAEQHGTKAPPDDKYHHGNLRQALIAAAEAELVESGHEHISLRAIARRANVSHAAPAHHFGDSAGLLTALAAVGFKRLNVAMQTELAAAGQSPGEQLAAIAVGYVRYAVDNPHLFKLMFSSLPRISSSNELQIVADEAFGTLVTIVARRSRRATFKTTDGWMDIAALWAAVHGYADLLIGRQMTLLTPAGFDSHRSAIRLVALRAVPADEPDDGAPADELDDGAPADQPGDGAPGAE
jgi:AcrR family transcriptional regulator